MVFKHLKLLWDDTGQRQILARLQSPTSTPLFIPCDDRRSLQAYRGHLFGLLQSLLFWTDFWPIWLIFLPFIVPVHACFWFWRRTQPQPGWLLDWDNLQLKSAQQNTDATYPLSPDMGLLAHHRQIDITHPTRGPLLTLFTAAASTDPLDQREQENLARTLAEKLNLRLVGCRVALK
ncbi:hypothetical protein [Limnohabitans sp. Rim8]|uniref:hypothetical protein n=1 Tax=Limnohabitans sp. Rim8 TaxID=1100718 RepID=UPI0025CEEBD9|nr:hypothetical protein [Limnohabitans sp. Rim8]